VIAALPESDHPRGFRVAVDACQARSVERIKQPIRAVGHPAERPEVDQIRLRCAAGAGQMRAILVWHPAFAIGC